MLTLMGVFAATYLLGGLSLFISQSTVDSVVFDLANQTVYSGILMLFFSIVCTIFYLTNRASYALKSFSLVSLVFLTGGYFLFTNWLLFGVLILLLATFLSSVLFNLQTSVFVLLAAQILVSAALAWFRFIPDTSVSIFQQAAGLSWLTLLIQTAVITTLFFTLTIVLINANNTALHKQEALKNQLDSDQKTLEERVYEHTRTLDITQDVNRLISTILDENRLIGDVAEQIRKAFNYYHVQVYLIQPDTKVLKIAGATGEAGTALLIGEHKLDWGVGLVGRAAKENASIHVDNVQESEDWVPNSLLPDTVSEVAVPITWDNTVLGVLDVQDNKQFTSAENHINTLETIAKQLGTAISNVNIFQQAEEQLKRESILNEMSLKLQVAPDVYSSMRVVGRHISSVLEPISVKISLDPELLQQSQGESE